MKQWLEGKIQPTKSMVTRFLKETYGYACDDCKISSWLGKPLSLEIDHKDGDHTNNHHLNFRYLCPNCHSQTPTYKGRNKGNGRQGINKNKTIC